MRHRFVISSAIFAIVAAVVLLTSGANVGAARFMMPPRGAIMATVGGPAASPPIAPGFLGLSLEYSAVASYAGPNPAAVNPVLVQLMRNLAPEPDQSPVLRIGGDSTDRTWWPVAGIPRPPGVTFTITPRWLAVVRSLARAIGGRLVLGINLEADSEALSAAEARAIVAQIPPSELAALELGNEPELYAAFRWYRTPDGQGVYGRPAGWEFKTFVQEYSRFATALPHVPLAGPTTGVSQWIRDVPRFLAAEPEVKLVTVHRYPLQRLYTRRDSPKFPTIAHLLAESSSRGLANSVAAYASMAHRRGLTLRVDELNSVACEGKPGVSNVFASALWALDTGFEMARVGVGGVNIHMLPGSAYQPFTVSRSGGRWQSFVEPEYYGLLMFAQAAPPGSQLLHVYSPAEAGVRIWATRAVNATVRIVLINDTAGRRVVAVQAPATPPAATASLEQLLAPSLRARTGVTLGGQSFGSQTNTGLLSGRSTVRSALRIDGDYVVTLPAYSAALLTLTSKRAS